MARPVTTRRSFSAPSSATPLTARPRTARPAPRRSSPRCAARPPPWCANWRKASPSRSRTPDRSPLSESQPMTFTVQFAPLAEVAADWLILLFPEDEAPFGAVAELDARLGGALTRLKEAGDLTGKPL